MKKIIFVLTLLLAACGQESAPTAQPENYSLEHKFAIVNVGHVVPETDPTIPRAKELLSRASEQYGQTEEKIADMAVAGADAIKEDGVDVSPIEVLEATTLAYSDQAEFGHIASLYLSLRKGGSSHAEAMMGAKGINNCLKTSC